MQYFFHLRASNDMLSLCFNFIMAISDAILTVLKIKFLVLRFNKIKLRKIKVELKN